jgi:hypothetical protein
MADDHRGPPRPMRSPQVTAADEVLGTYTGGQYPSGMRTRSSQALSQLTHPTGVTAGEQHEQLDRPAAG